jgi:hypothetical protein
VVVEVDKIVILHHQVLQVVQELLVKEILEVLVLVVALQHLVEVVVVQAQ